MNSKVVDTAAVPAAPRDARGDVRSSHPAVRLSRVLALGSVLGLIVLGLSWELWLAPTGSGTLAVKVAPLLLALPGLLCWRLYTYRWLSLLVWLYFAEGALRATSEAGMSQALALVELLLSLSLFAACALHVRGRLAGARLAAGSERDQT